MKNYKNWILLVMFGSLWGVVEVFVGEGLFGKNIPHASVLLAAWAFLILALARGVLNEPGSSTAVGSFAAVFKLVNAAPFYCHLLAIFMLGLAFDLFCSLLLKKERKNFFRRALTGILAAYGGYAFFALMITYIIRYEFWTAGGWPKVSHYIFVGGSWAALGAALVVPLGLALGSRGWPVIARRPRWAYGSALAVLIIIWALGRVVG
jgi:hypothetical protein